jgi:hypothetical protein
MNETLRQSLINQAVERHGVILPVNRHKSLDDCFTIMDDKLYFWYNDLARSTHVVSAELN